MNLLELSKEKGFISRDKLVTVNKDYYHLWMCEVQKWLREEHNLIIVISYIYEFDSTPYTYFILRKGESSPINEWKEDFSTYEQALEAALIHTLNLI